MDRLNWKGKEETEEVVEVGDQVGAWCLIGPVQGNQATDKQFLGSRLKMFQETANLVMVANKTKDHMIPLSAKQDSFTQTHTEFQISLESFLMPKPALM